MSGYITTTYFQDRFGLAALRTIIPTVDSNGAPSPVYPNFVVDTARLERLIEISSRLIDSYVAGRLSTPITGTVPGLIQDICYHITAEMCYTGPDKPIEITENRKTAIETLEKIQKGSIFVGDGAAVSSITAVYPDESTERGEYGSDYRDGQVVEFPWNLHDLGDNSTDFSSGL